MMYANASRAAQSRVVRSVLDGTRSSGIDETAFRPEYGTQDERAVIISRKAQIDRDLTKVNADLAFCNGKHSGATNSAFVVGLKRRRAELAAEAQELQGALSELRLKKAHSDEAENLTFERRFMRMARMILAGPVYDRVMAATVHDEASDA